jgi:hypothetical protein
LISTSRPYRRCDLHIHTTQASAAGNALAAAQSAETAIAMRRARELREKADKIKALSSGSDEDFAPNFASDPQVVSMLGGWAAAATSGQPPIRPAEALPRAPTALPLDLSADLISEPISEEIERSPVSNSSPVSFWA